MTLRKPGDKLKMTGVSAWGPLQLGNEGGYFWGATNLNLTASDGPDLALTNNLRMPSSTRPA